MTQMIGRKLVFTYTLKKDNISERSELMKQVKDIYRMIHVADWMHEQQSRSKLHASYMLRRLKKLFGFRHNTLPLIYIIFITVLKLNFPSTSIL